MRTGKKVAVIGSGPAGLAAAAQLNRAGHTVTVLERDDRPGGLLMYGIPNMKLDKQEVVMRRIELMEKEGIKFICNANVGENVGADAAAARTSTPSSSAPARPSRATCTWRAASLKGVHFAMEYLTASTKAIAQRRPGQQLRSTRATRHVIVIGGGDTGTDCVGTAMRQGCKSLTQIEILPRPPMDRAEDNPWPEWPKVYKLDYGQEEAAATVRRRSARVRHDGQEAERRCRRVRAITGDGADFVAEGFERAARADGGAGQREGVPAELVLLAMGFTGPEQPLLRELGIETDARSNIEPNMAGSRRTSKACSPRGIAGAVKAWSCGPSMRAAAPRGSAIGI